MQRLLNSKVESVGFDQAAPKCTTKLVDFWDLPTHIVVAKCPEHSQKGKSIQTKLTSLSRKYKE